MTEILAKFADIEPDRRELIINEDQATKSKSNLNNEIAGIMRRITKDYNAEVN